MIAIWTSLALAHPFGAAHFGHALHVTVDEEAAVVSYRAEVPADQWLRWMAAKRWEDKKNGVKQDFTASMVGQVRDGVQIAVDHRPVSAEATVSAKSPGGNAEFFLVEVEYTVALPHHGGVLEVRNDNFPGETAFYSSEVLVGPGIAVEDCSLFSLDAGEVAADGSGSWSADARHRNLVLRYKAGQSGLIARTIWGEEGAYRRAAEAVEVDPMIALLQGRVTLGVGLWALALSFFFGAAHAMSPGHGKALVAGYLVGQRGTVRDAELLGLVVTASHVFSVALLGALTLWLTDRFAPEAVFPWIELLSGLLVLGLGGTLGVERYRAWRADRVAACRVQTTFSRDPEVCSHAGARFHLNPGEMHLEVVEKTGFSLLPKPSEPSSAAHALDHLLGREHNHLPKNQEAPTLFALLSLGISGGIVPCPSALVVLLTAFSLHQVVLGLWMVGAFSLGLASVLVSVAVAVVLLGKRLEGRLESSGLLRFLPVLSAALVIAVGAVITLRAVLGL